MIIQIFGKKNCNETKKAERFLKERGIKCQLIDLSEKVFSKRELDNIKKYYTIEELIDIDGKEYKKRNLQYYVYDTEKLLLENPILFKTPIIRYEKGVIVGFSKEKMEKIV